MDPYRAGSYLNLALLQERNKEFASAEQNFRKSLALDPKSVNVDDSPGAILRGTKRLARAERQFRAAITLAPQGSNVRTILATFYLLQGQPDKAEQVCVKQKQP